MSNGLHTSQCTSGSCTGGTLLLSYKKENQLDFYKTHTLHVYIILHITLHNKIFMLLHCS